MAQPVKKIAILGGGLGSLSTAFALTDESDWKERYEITIYQMGWRLGGKCASGRNLDPDYQYRIEEHGFHVWMGFYDNAFAMIKRAYSDIARATGPFRTWSDAFKKHSLVIIEEQHEGQRKHWQVRFPEGPREPGTSIQLGLFGYVGRLFAIMFRRVPTEFPKNKKAPRTVRSWRFLRRQVEFVMRVIAIALLLVLALVEYFLRLLEKKAARVLVRPLAFLARGVRMLVEGVSAMVAAWGGGTDALDPDEPRRIRIFFDLSLAILRGILVDDIIAKGFGSIDHLEFRDWLRKHNASEESANAAIIESIYDGNFSFVGGDRTKPNLAAGVALHCYLRIFLDYKGAFLYKMQAGMGDVVIAPMYLALKKRGVQFKFFHKVEELMYDAANNQISAIRMREQVTLLNGDYNPLVPVPLPEGNLECWPSAPRYECIRDGTALAASGINLESNWAKPWKDSRPKTLTLGTDYDLVVLGISIGGLPGICRQLIDHFPEWRSMIEKVDTVATQAMQLWLAPTIGDLGWTLPSALVVNYEDPASNWLDASQVIAHEPLKATSVKSVAYFCSALEDARHTPEAGASTFAEDQRLAVQHTHERWIEQHAGFLWPAMSTIAGRSGVVNWDLLHDPLNRVGPASLGWQYFRANVEPSDRFVLSSVGATTFRLPPHDSKVDNLKLAGDWTRNGFNCGCVEATVISGLLCSRAISGSPRSFFGEHPFGMFNL
jgi:uncharacterized protein with NAD-binding domain and iron-sulfur cluster